MRSARKSRPGGEPHRSFVNLPDMSPPHQSLDQRPELSLDTIFRLLSNRSRRHVLAYLASETDVVHLTELVAAVVARKSSENTDDDAPDAAVALAVRHNHLPKLEGVGVLEYDARSRTIRYYGHPKLETYLELARTFETESDAIPVQRPD